MNRYMIIGQTPDGVEHFINFSSGRDSYLKMLIRTLSYRCKKRFRARYCNIYMRKITDDFWVQQERKYKENYEKHIL